ncbi:MAG: PQQ-dependent sugar dehydrogenase [Acidimicrobiales bacterium]
MRRGLAVLLAAALLAPALLAACTDDDPAVSGTTTTTVAPGGATSSTAPPAQGTLGSVRLDVEEIVELDEPIALAARPGSPDLYIAEKGGMVRLVKVTENETTEEVTYQIQTTPLLDLSDDVINEGERGLLGMTFSSDGRTLYLDYTREPDGHTVVVEYQLGDGTTIVRDSRRELLVVEQPFANHNGGQLVIGPDGFLYIGLGDGGAGGDPEGHGQDTSTLLGSILRIDPGRAAEDDPDYVIPPGNPFADGEDGAPEIWLYGVRNPWRFTFDAGTGDLWVADVGQNSFEEINRLPSIGGFDAGKGDNLGWNEMEATHPFEGGENPLGGVLPIYEYGRNDGCSVIGGYVYRGDEIPGLDGAYLFADFCGRGISGLQLEGDALIDARGWDLPVEELHSFGQGDDGEIYLLLASGPVLKVIAG